MAVAAMITGSLTTAYAADEKVTYYFVDCGDYVVNTVTSADAFADDTRDDSDAMGIYQSVTDKAYGADAGTGKSWGIVADTYDLGDYDGSLGIRLQYAWAFESNGPSSDWHRNWSNTYSKDTPQGQTPTLTWKFELPAGTYEVEACFVDPWGVSDNITLKGNDTQIGETLGDIIQTNGGAADIETKYGGSTVKGNVTVGEDGVLTLVATSASLCVNCAWIKIVGDAPTTNNNTNTNTINNSSSAQDTADFAAVMPMVALAVVAMAAVMVARKRTVTE